MEPNHTQQDTVLAASHVPLPSRKGRREIKSALLALPVALGLLLASTVTSAATVRFDPVSSSENLGQTFSLKLIGEGFASSLDGGGLNLSFDPAVLSVNSVTLNTGVWDFVTGVGPIDNIAGSVSDIIFNSFAGRSGNFDIGTISFLAKGLGHSDLGLSASTTNPFASGGLPLPVNLTKGSVTVVPLPAAIWLLMTGLGALSLVRRRAS